MFGKRTKKPAPIRRVRPSPDNATTNRVFSYNSVRRNSIDDVTENMSAQKKRGEETSRQRTYVRAKQALVIIGLISIVGIVLVNSRIDVNDTTIVMRGTPEQRLLLQNKEVYAKAVTRAVDDNTWNRMKVTLDQEKLNNQLVTQFPELSKTQASLSIFGGGYTVYLSPSSAMLLFTTNDNKSFIVDNSGRVVSTDAVKAPQGLISVKDQSGIQPEPGLQILPRRDVVAIQAVVYQLRQHEMEVASLTLPSTAQRLEATVQGSPYYIKFSLHENIEQQVGAYITVAKKLQRDGVVPAEYVDARVADRVYYK